MRSLVLPLLLLCLLTAMSIPAFAAETAATGDWLDACNVVWTTPSESSAGSMPLGNGDLGLNLWVEPSGDLVFYLSKTDAWDAHARLLKLGRVRVKLLPAGLPPGAPFKQTLQLRQGQIEIVRGVGSGTAKLRVWVDANQPVVRIEIEADKPLDVEAALELWRTKEGPLVGKQLDAARGLHGAPYKLIAPADTVLDTPDRITWYHRNVSSCWPITMKVQGLEGLIPQSHDPLLHRAFGGAIEGEGMQKTGPTTLKSRQPAARRLISVYAATKQIATGEEWAAEMNRIVTQVADLLPYGDAYQAHRAWWDDFWNRSWIRVEGASMGPEMTTNDLPLRIGANSQGGSHFHGQIARPMVFSRALTPTEVAALAAGKDEALLKDPSLVGCWDFANHKDGLFVNAAEGLPAKIVGEVEVVDGPKGKAVRLNGKGWVEVADSPKLQLKTACTLAAWVNLDKSSTFDGRVFDKSKVATNNGYLLDTYPNNSLRMITEPCTLSHKGCLTPGRWTHVAATFDSSGELCLYLDGKRAASQRIGGEVSQVTQGYALQRFINACGGRGASPIKFNGSIFTVDAEGSDGDYRRWGGCYWWQNTRFPYWPMLACGDFDLMWPLMKMYLDALPLAKGITKTYYGHEGAFFAETIYFWGTPCNDDFGWNRKGQPQSLMLNEYIRRNWEGGIELAMMMLDYYEFTGDRKFAEERLAPFAEAIARFYAEHYPKEADGTLRIEPAQSLETWWTAVNPMPEVAGLHAVLPRLLALPNDIGTVEQRLIWKRLRERLPPVPVRQAGDKRVLAPAQEFSRRGNIENPELYAIFPYRLYGIGREGLDLARASFAAREVKGSQGWQQDPVQSAMLGEADQAARFVVHRFATKDAHSRFPAFWGPNFDWTPDQCHGGNAMLGLQAMVLQHAGDKLYLLPAWPKGWDVAFKLHAPRKTTVEGVYRGGKWQSLKVVPEGRAKDVVKCEPQ